MRLVTISWFSLGFATERLVMSFTSRLLDWYDRSRRELPWRALPGTPVDAYRVWLSEIMLQQTTVAAVKEYYLDFTSRWPDVHALAAADLDMVLKRWAGLGYYARARNLHKCARIVADRHEGRFPRSADELVKLPGIGPYTAAAVAAIAFDEPVAAVDGNVERVISRLYAIETPLPDSKPQIKTLTQDLVPGERPGDFAQAMMDLGATVCAPRKANCLICPVQALCEARRLGVAEELPRKRPKPARPTRFGTVFWIERDDGAVLLHRREEQGLLGGMMEVPSTPWSEVAAIEPLHQAPIAAHWTRCDDVVEHTFTHFHLRLNVVRARIATNQTGPGMGPGCRWVKPQDLLDEALPSVMKKVVAAVLGPDAFKRRR